MRGIGLLLPAGRQMEYADRNKATVRQQGHHHSTNNLSCKQRPEVDEDRGQERTEVRRGEAEILGIKYR
jgi:hypothetical protein